MSGIYVCVFFYNYMSDKTLWLSSRQTTVFYMCVSGAARSVEQETQGEEGDD